MSDDIRDMPWGNVFPTHQPCQAEGLKERLDKVQETLVEILDELRNMHGEARIHARMSKWSR